MARGTKDFSIGDNKYMITQFQTDKAMRVLVRLAHIVGESVSLFAATAGKPNELKAVIPKAISSIVYNLDEEKSLQLVKDLMSCCIVVGQGSTTADQVFNTHFQGRIGDMLKLSVEVVNHNYENFFDVVGSLVPSNSVNPETRGQ